MKDRDLRPIRRGAFVAAIGLLAAGAAGAEEPAPSYPTLTVDLTAEMQNDYVFAAEASDDRLNDTYLDIEPTFQLNFTPELSLRSGLILEPVRDPDPGEDRFLGDHGLYAETLLLYYEGRRFDLYGGKFNPPFGIAWDVAPGIYGDNFAEDYELTERIGFGGAVKFDDERLGSHSLSLNAFFLDTSVLSGSLFTDRGELDRSDGGLSNTGGLSSFTAALTGDVPGVAGLAYHAAASHQKGGRGDPKNETGLVAALIGDFALTSEVTLGPIVEYAHFFNAGGIDEDRDYLTLGSGLSVGRWNVAAVYALRGIDPAGGSAPDDHLLQLSGGYELLPGLTLDIGYRYAEVEGDSSHTLGLLLSFEGSFRLF